VTNMAQLEDRVFEIVARTFQVPRATVGLESAPATISAWDSLQHVHLVLAIEEEFGVQFGVDDIATMNRVSTIITLLRERVDGV